MKRTRPLIAIAVAVLALLSALPGVDAQQFSPAIAPSKIEVTEPLGQGDDVDLPPLSVANRSAFRATFEIDVTYIGDQAEGIPDLEWFHFEPQRFELDPGDGQVVEVRVSLPRNAKVGDYRALLRARTVATEGPGAAGVAITAAVATTVLFSVENVDFHFYDPTLDFLNDRAPFSYVGIGLLVAALAVYLFQMRYGVNVNFGIRLRRKE